MVQKNVIEFIDCDENYNGAGLQRNEIRDIDEFNKIMNDVQAHEDGKRKLMSFTEEQKEMIVKALMNDQEEGFFDTPESKKMYEDIFDQLEGKDGSFWNAEN